MKTRMFFVSVLVALSFSVGCAASPEEVCDHTAKLMAKELKAEFDKAKTDTPADADKAKIEEASKAKSDEMIKEFKKGCVKSISKSKESMGYFKYRTRSRCIVGASTLNEAKKCK